MAASLFIKARKLVTQWLEDSKERFNSRNIVIQIIENNEERLFVVLNFEVCMAAIVVAEHEYTPYSSVSFEAFDIVNGIHKMVHAWYDDESTTTEEVVDNLNKAIDIVLEYLNHDKW